MANVQRGHIDLSDVAEIEELPHDHERYALNEGDLLLVEGHASPAEIGRCALVTGPASGLLHQNHLFCLRSDKVLPKFSEIWLNSSHARSYWLSESATSSGLYTINRNALERMPFPLVDSTVQRRVVDVLSALDVRIAVESQALQKTTLLWDGLINQRLEEHVREYDSARLADVCLGRGSYGSNAAAVARDGRMPRYVRITDIDEQGNLSADVSSTVSVPWVSARPYILEGGDLLIARTGFTTGKSYLYRPSDGLCAYAGYLVRFRVDPSVMLPEYAFMWTRANVFRKWVSRNVREVGQRNISAREYDGHHIAVPPLEVQRELVDAWEAARSTSLLRQQEISRLRTMKQAIADDLLVMVNTGA
ncbi:hypothetical protein [Streptomyces virginiae]|nr:hypothetical protein [Streptomyces virginiae]MBP2345979.1 type I restriction enzyme S subunit [Streptomyces virginiae]